MKEKFSIGDIVKSIAGRDKDKIFLVVGYDDEKVIIVNGKERKVNSPKRKNVKHLSKVLIAGDIELAKKIQSGKPTSNEKVYKSVKTKTEKIQED
jgi:ribosomal protein L14E/L6E/L27E